MWLNSWLSWHSHIPYICHKANRTLRFLQSNFRTCPTHLKEVAYKQLVLTIIEHWAPSYNRDLQNQCDTQLLEMVHYQAAHFVLNKPRSHSDNDNVTEMLQYLKWPVLQTHCKYLRPSYIIINHLLMIPNQYLPAPAQLATQYKI